MPQPQIDILSRRILAAQSSIGRWYVNTAAALQRSNWRCTVATAHYIKRTIDIIGGAMLLIAFSPVFLTLAILIKLEDGGPIFFPQVRVGKFGRIFIMYKFRSMCLDAEKRLKEILAQNQHGDGVTFKIKDDPRVTKVGKWIRKYSLDEFPQFLNVLLGDMSLVGPRPPVPREVIKYTLADRRRLAVTPGITCLWQIAGRSEIPFPQQVELDVAYIETQTLWGDVKILAKTVPAVLHTKGAY